MVGYSKQWCEIWDKDDDLFNFDLDLVISEMNHGQYHPVTCNGLGLKCIHKDAHGGVWAAFSQSGETYTNWRRYNNIIIEEKKKANKK